MDVRTMYKTSMLLCKIHKSLQVKFELILEDDPVAVAHRKAMGWNAEPAARKFRFNNNLYFRVQPHPFVTIDIASKADRKDGWSSAYQVSLNQRTLFSFRKRLQELLDIFKEEKDLFYMYESGELVVDQRLAEKHRKLVNTGSKVIVLQACPVQDEENPNIYYEGCLLAINRLDVYTQMTYEEMEFLLDTLNHLSIGELAVQLMTLERLYPEEQGTPFPSRPKPEPTPEPLREQPFVTKKEPKQIPNI